jgi:hypothetical protein
MTRKLLPFLLLALSAPAWGAYAYSYHPTLSHTMVSGSSDLATYTVYVHLSGTDFKDVAHGGLIQNSTTFNGQTVPADFQEDTTSTCTGSLGSTRDYFDIEKWDNVNGTIDMFVGPITLSHTADWTPYFCMDDSGSTGYKGGAVGQAWNSNYVFINHAASGTSPVDSSSNQYSITPSNGSSTSGIIDGARAYSYFGDYYDTVATGLNVTGTEVTVEAWVYVTNFDNGPSFIYKTNSWVRPSWSIRTAGGFTLYCDFSNGSDTEVSATGATTLLTSTVYYLVCSMTSGHVYGYVNGVQDGTSSSSVNMISTSSATYLSLTTASTEAFAGWMDEERISKVHISPDALLTNFRNINNYGSYFTIGSKSAVGGGAATVTMTPIIM